MLKVAVYILIQAVCVSFTFANKLLTRYFSNLANTTYVMDSLIIYVVSSSILWGIMLFTLVSVYKKLPDNAVLVLNIVFVILQSVIYTIAFYNPRYSLNRELLCLLGGNIFLLISSIHKKLKTRIQNKPT